MKTKNMIFGVIAACILAFNAGTAEAAGIKKAAITKGVSFVKKTFDNVGNAIWNNKGAIAVGTAAVAVATQPDILAQPLTSASVAVATETSRAVRSSPIGTIGMALFFAAMLVIVWTMVCVARHYLKLWHIVPLLTTGMYLISCGVTEAAVQGMPVIQCAATFKPFWDVLGVLLFIITIFM